MIELIQKYLIARQIAKEMEKVELKLPRHYFQKGYEVERPYASPKEVYKEIPVGLMQYNSKR